VRKCAVHAYLDLLSIPDFISRIPRTILKVIKRTKTEQTVQHIRSFMTWEVFTISVLKKFM